MKRARYSVEQVIAILKRVDEKTLRICDRLTASKIASTSLASFLFDLRYG